MGKELREFLLKGDVVDLAVAVVLGAALARDRSHFAGQRHHHAADRSDPGRNRLSPACRRYRWVRQRLPYGRIYQAIVNFIIIGVSIFFVIKAANKLMVEKEPR